MRHGCATVYLCADSSPDQPGFVRPSCGLLLMKAPGSSVSEVVPRNIYMTLFPSKHFWRFPPHLSSIGWGAFWPWRRNRTTATSPSAKPWNATRATRARRATHRRQRTPQQRSWRRGWRRPKILRYHWPCWVPRLSNWGTMNDGFPVCSNHWGKDLESL